MTLSESEYSDIVEVRLKNFFGDKNVWRQVYLEKYERWCDFVVYTPFVTIMIEVENRPEEYIDGIGQCILYSRHHQLSVGIVVCPPTEKKNLLLEIRQVSDVVPIVFVQDEI